MEYEVLSPRADVDPIEQIALNPRLTDLNTATIGLYTTFKAHWELILEEIAKQIHDRYPGSKFTRFVYPKDLNSYTAWAELSKDPEYLPRFEEWIKGVDAVVVANGDASSCTLYLTYNATFPEHLGKPTVLTVHEGFYALAKRAEELRGVPALRTVKLDLLDLSQEPHLDRFVNEVIPQRVADCIDEIIAGLTAALTEAEAAVPANPENTPRVAMKGNLDEVNAAFYANRWAYGMPVMPPTEEKVRELLTGTDLPPDYVVAKIPPLLGKATVEKIAVNGAMAGCLPIHMPALIAAVEATADPAVWVEAYTCSLASWAPLLMINGPIRKDLDLGCGSSVLTPYHKGSAAIAHGLGLVFMNVGGVEEGLTDMGRFGHEGRFGICIAENEEASPWEPMHVYYGLQPEDSAVTMSWPNTRNIFTLPENFQTILRFICDRVPAFGFDPGCTLILSPALAKFLHANGFSRKNLVDYLVEYARIPAGNRNMRWWTGNHHEPPDDIPLPLGETTSVRKFWSARHLPVVVAGGPGMGIALYDGGGDHGGPITKKMQLPKNWDELAARYAVKR